MKIILASLIILSINCFGQENLKFSNAIYINISSNKTSNYIAKDTTIIIPEGKVWKITNTKVFMTYDNRIMEDNTFLFLNNQLITFQNERTLQISDPIWLPSGRYNLTIKTVDKERSDGKFFYNAFISGVEYLMTGKE